MGSPATACGQKRIAFADIGNWSSKEGLPQRIVEGKNGCLMFQSESNNSWYYEISDAGGYYLTVRRELCKHARRAVYAGNA